jgi:hypothetical protein
MKAKTLKAYEVQQVGQNILIVDSSGHQINSADITAVFDFLLEPCSDTMKVFWDLDAAVAPILRALGSEICRKIAETHAAVFGDDDSEVTYSIFYLNNKQFTLKKVSGSSHTKQEATFYGLNGFFNDDEPEPASACALQERGDKLLSEMGKVGIFPTKLTSPVAAYLSGCKLPSLPTISDLPDQFLDAQFYAEECVGREWRENLAVGHYADDECFSYDLSCAYGAIAAGLPDLRYGEFIHSKEMLDSAYWGFCRGRVTINADVRVSPIVARLGDGTQVHPVGSWNTFLTLDEIRFIQRHRIGTFVLADGWFIKFKNFVAPLGETMERLYAYRTRSDRILNTVLKRIPSGICGLFHQHHENGLGQFFNPIWFAEVTTINRLKVARLIYENNAQNHIVKINIDGLMADRPLLIARGTRMGAWRQVPSQATLILSPELVFAGTKHPNGLDYAKLRTLVCEHPKSALYEDRTIKKRVSLPEAVNNHNLASLGKITTRSARIDLTLLAQSQIRDFSRFPRNGEQLINGKYGSTPISL